MQMQLPCHIDQWRFCWFFYSQPTFSMHSFGAKINAVLFSGALGKAIAAPPEGKGSGCAVWATSPEQ